MLGIALYRCWWAAVVRDAILGGFSVFAGQIRRWQHGQFQRLAPALLDDVQRHQSQPLELPAVNCTI
jgi:hypothetical protein